MRGADAFERFRFLASAKPKAPAVGSELQPIAFDPVAAWALLDDDTAGSAPQLARPACLVDRVTGAYPLTRGSVWAAPDLIKRFRSSNCNGPGDIAAPYGRDDGNFHGDNTFRFPGEFTASFRVWWSGAKPTQYPALIDCSEGWGARNAGGGGVQTLWRMYMNHGNGSRLGGYHQLSTDGGYSYNDYGWESTLTLVPGKWTYIALRRSALGAYTINVDDQQQTGPNFTLPNPAYGNPVLNIGQWGAVQRGPGNIYPGADPWCGGQADVMLWNKRLTDAQVQNQRSVMFAIEVAA